MTLLAELLGQLAGHLFLLLQRLEEGSRPWRERLSRWLHPVLKRIWYVHPDVILIVYASPRACLQALATAARPSAQRLHLRNLFAQGRRYHIQPGKDGFRLTTTSKVLWHYRRRTSSSAVMNGTFTRLDDSITRLHLRVRIHLLYMLGAILIPAFITSLLIFKPWPFWVIAPLLAALYVLSWMGRRFNAALEANEMVYFVEKALEDFAPSGVASLNDKGPDLVYEGDTFATEWEKFYRSHRGDRS